MISTETVYEGSVPCACGKFLTPVEAMWGGLCEDCTRDKMRALLSNRMVKER